MLFGLLGGLGLFIYGMRTLSDGLQKMAAERLRRLLEVLTTNPAMGVLVGAVVTALLQSSSATTVMVVGFVNAGLMTLHQAAGVIMGANIGTTVTAQIIALKATNLALPAIAFGMVVMLAGHKQRVRFLGQTMIGFGLLFLGMSTMTGAMKPLAHMPWFAELTATLSRNRLLGVLTGVGLTGLVQSSSATIGILQGLAGEGIISLSSALPILFGDNIGTCVTALLSSIGASLAARRAALIHLTFNILGTILFMLFLPILLPLVRFLGTDPVHQIANTHTLFNVTNTLIQLPFVSVLVFIATRLLPGRVDTPQRPQYLDHRFLETPAFALEQVNKELILMGRKASQTVDLAIDGLIHDNEELVKEAFRLEQEVNQLERDITHYLVALSKRSLNDEESEAISLMLNVVNDLERIGDHGENIGELALEKIKEKLAFSHEAQEELTLMKNKVLYLVGQAIAVLERDDKETAKHLYKQEEEIDRLEQQLRSNHIARLNAGSCVPTSGIIFLDTISNLERVADHAGNIGNWVSQPTSVFNSK